MNKFLLLCIILFLPERNAFARVDLASLSIVNQEVLGGSIPRGAQRIPVLEFTLATPCGDPVTLSGLTVQHQGVGDTADIVGVYLMKDGSRLTRGVSFSQSTALLRPASLPLDPCKKVAFSLFADFSNDVLAMGEHRFFIKRVQYLQGGTEKSTDAELQNAGTATRKLVGPTLGTIFADFLRLERKVTFGENRRIARFTLEASSEGDHRIKRITLTNNGSARGADLKNLYLQNPRGDLLTPKAVAMDKDTVTLTFMPPFILERGEKRLMLLHADVRASKKRTIQFGLEEPSDIDATPARVR